jgi:hypothetical protein
MAIQPAGFRRVAFIHAYPEPKERTLMAMREFVGAASAYGGAQPGRRAFLGLVAAGMAITGTGVERAVAAVSERRRRLVRRTLAVPGTSGVQRPGYPVELVGVSWPAGPTPRIRFATSAGRFGRWQVVRPGCPGDRDDPTMPGIRAALIAAGGAAAYELTPPRGVRSVALNTTRGPLIRLPEPAGSERTHLAGSIYLSRAAWGADESLRFDETGAERYPQTYWPIQTLTVHHTATSNGDADPGARMRAIYRFNTIDRNFGDIGYHFLIDEAGRIYEGRWSGEDGLPGFDAVGRMVSAAHVARHNPGNVGVALLGTFVAHSPTPAARACLTLLLAAIAGWQRLDPLGTTRYVHPVNGATRTVSTISGHREWVPTECPGGVLAGELQKIREDVAALIGRPTSTPGEGKREIASDV